MLIPLIFSYAEIHYHLKYLYPKYFQKQPEIIADVPFRICKNPDNILPILYIIKDADLFPIEIIQIEVIIKTSAEVIKQKFQINEQISQKYHSNLLYLNIPELQSEQEIALTVIFQIIDSNLKYCTIINDNFKGLAFNPFRCYISETALPYPNHWYAGEPHYHSNFTDDQVEFGADIHSTKIMGKALGLKWLFITDHSYDLDDCEDNYLVNDPNIGKWKKLDREVKNESEEDFKIIRGEEVSIGNNLNQNVHLLAINHTELIEGKGDSAEKWFDNKPQRQLHEIRKLQSKNNIFIAAHPFEKISWIQKLTLNRGNWDIDDLKQSGVNFLQLINSNNFKDIKKQISNWARLLLQGHQFYLIAGNDAHGNFNVMRQIKLPFLKLFHSYDQIFGKFHTVFHYSQNNPIQGLKNREVFVSNGPFLNFFLIGKSNKKYPIGSFFKEKKATLNFEAKTSLEFGEIKIIKLFIGDFKENREKKLILIKNYIKLKLPFNGYLRMELYTNKNGMVFTNPIWIYHNKKYGCVINLMYLDKF
ncbi:MAG: CehA/McbA family metallohydrolase [Candidatus Cloacimonetes bacterium]|nr:CehA/McbA family metallohydrolase [Candidatus Cloacimonadota bacterium]